MCFIQTIDSPTVFSRLSIRIFRCLSEAVRKTRLTLLWCAVFQNAKLAREHFMFVMVCSSFFLSERSALGAVTGATHRHNHVFGTDRGSVYLHMCCNRV